MILHQSYCPQSMPMALCWSWILWAERLWYKCIITSWFVWMVSLSTCKISEGFVKESCQTHRTQNATFVFCNSFRCTLFLKPSWVRYTANLGYHFYWHLSVDRLWSSNLRGCWWASSCVSVEASPGFTISAATLGCEDRCVMQVLVVLLMADCSPGQSFIIFHLDGSLPSFQSLWRLLLPQGSVICKGFPCLSVNVECFYVMLAYVLES